MIKNTIAISTHKPRDRVDHLWHEDIVLEECPFCWVEGNLYNSGIVTDSYLGGYNWFDVWLIGSKVPEGRQFYRGQAFSGLKTDRDGKV